MAEVIVDLGRLEAFLVFDDADVYSDATTVKPIRVRGAGVSPISVASVDISGTITFGDGASIVIGTSSGLKFGTATGQKIGFWNKTPVIQPAGAAQAALTNSTGGTGDGTLSACGDTTAADQSGVINDNFTELFTLLNAIRTALVDAGLMKGAA